MSYIIAVQLLTTLTVVWLSTLSKTIYNELSHELTYLNEKP